MFHFHITVVVYVNVRFNYTVLDTHLGYLGCLGQWVTVLDGEREEDAVTLHLLTEPLKTCELWPASLLGDG